MKGTLQSGIELQCVADKEGARAEPEHVFSGTLPPVRFPGPQVAPGETTPDAELVRVGLAEEENPQEEDGDVADLGEEGLMA